MKKVERFYLENFFKLLCGKPFEIKERESPDFIVTFLSIKKVGVEVVEYHSSLKTANGKPRRAFEETMDRLYKDLYEEAQKYPELIGIDVFLKFKELRVLPKSEHKEFTDQVIQLTLEKIQNIIHISNSLEVKPDGRKYPLLHQYLDRVRLYKTDFPSHRHWGGVDASSIGLEENELIDAIQTKIKKAKTYRKEIIKEGIGELWLLIVSGYRPSQTLPPPEHLKYKLGSFDQLDNLLKASGYDKVYLYQYMFDIIYKWPGWIKIEKR
jgi:hypothetical protein